MYIEELQANRSRNTINCWHTIQTFTDVACSSVLVALDCVHNVVQCTMKKEIDHSEVVCSKPGVRTILIVTNSDVESALSNAMCNDLCVSVFVRTRSCWGFAAQTDLYSTLWS